MRRIKLAAAARAQMRDIYRYGAERWGKNQADIYARELASKFEAIAEDRALKRQVPAAIGVQGYFCTCGMHFIYWRRLSNDAVAIVAVLHQNMHQPDRIRRAFKASL